MTTDRRALAVDLTPLSRPAGVAVGGRCKRSAASVAGVVLPKGICYGNSRVVPVPVARYDMRYAYVALRSLRSLRPRSLRSGGCKNNGHGQGNGNGKSQGNGGSLGVVSMGVFLAGERF